MKLILFFANIHNWFADKDFLWWPFAWMKPKQNEIMTYKRSAQFAAAFSGFLTIILSALSWVQLQFSFLYFFSVGIFSFLLFLIWFSFVTKPLWNLRAEKLSRK